MNIRIEFAEKGQLWTSRCQAIRDNNLGSFLFLGGNMLMDGSSASGPILESKGSKGNRNMIPKSYFILEKLKTITSVSGAVCVTVSKHDSPIGNSHSLKTIVWLRKCKPHTCALSYCLLHLKNGLPFESLGWGVCM